MHAAIVTVELDPSRNDEVNRILHEMVVPQVKAAPGFVSGTWTQSADGSEGRALVVFESAEAANAGAAMAREGAAPADVPVKFVSAEVYEVVAQA